MGSQVVGQDQGGTRDNGREIASRMERESGVAKLGLCGFQKVVCLMHAAWWELELELTLMPLRLTEYILCTTLTMWGVTACTAEGVCSSRTLSGSRRPPLGVP